MFRRVQAAAILAALALGLGVGATAARPDVERAAPPRLQPPPPQLRDPEPDPPKANELVSGFTTRHTPGEPRVVNIRLAVRLLDGTVLSPGETFSMNAALGRRTVESGFVPAPTIVGGRLVDSVGGGISQAATTLFRSLPLDWREATTSSFAGPAAGSSRSSRRCSVIEDAF